MTVTVGRIEDGLRDIGADSGTHLGTSGRIQGRTDKAFADTKASIIGHRKMISVAGEVKKEALGISKANSILRQSKL